MKKIFYIITKSNWGGAQLYVYNLATHLKSERFEPTVIAGGSGELSTRLQSASIPYISLPSLERDINLRGDLDTLKDLMRLFRAERPDIIHLNSSKIGIIGALAGRIAGVPKIIFTAHGWPFNEPRGFLWRLSIRFASYLTSLLATNTVVIHQRDLRETRYWFIARKKVSLIHSGVGENPYFSKIEAREKIEALVGKPRNYFSSKIIVGNIAELHRNKGLVYAISAIKLLPAHYIYVIFGEGEERALLEKMVKVQGLTDRVFLPGFVSSGSKFMKGFDVFLFPSVKEGLSFTILEAGLAGLPVVATDVGGTPDIIKNKFSGILVPAKNPELLSKAILELTEKPDIAKEYGEQLQASVLKDFDLEKMLQETTTLYLKP